MRFRSHRNLIYRNGSDGRDGDGSDVFNRQASGAVSMTTKLDVYRLQNTNFLLEANVIISDIALAPAYENSEAFVAF